MTTAPGPPRLTAIYTVDDGGRTWLVHLAEEERVHSHGRTFLRARANIVEAAALWFNVDESEIDVADALPPSYQEPIEQLRVARAKLEADQAEVQGRTAEAVAMLRNWCNMSERDIASLVGISHQRVHQLLAASS